MARPLWQIDAELRRLQAEKKGQVGMDEYRRQKNSLSIDGLPGL